MLVFFFRTTQNKTGNGRFGYTEIKCKKYDVCGVDVELEKEKGELSKLR